MLIEMEHVKKTYKKKEFVLDCSLELQEGHVTGLIGANGAGKTTTFKAILDLIRPEDGTIRIFGKENQTLTRADKEQIGVVLPEQTFSGTLKVKDIIPVMAAMYPSFDRAAFEEKCRQYEIPFKKQIKEFSTGMKAKLKLLIATSYQAQLLILDEPTSGLDSMVRSDLLDLLLEYMEKENRGILISSHISGDLEKICDDIYLIHDGKIIFHEDTDVILSDYAVLKVDQEQYQKLDRSYILYEKEESFGYGILTDQRQFYQENYPEIVIEKSGIDEVLMMMERGRKVR